jgi:hypothetical protein
LIWCPRSLFGVNDWSCCGGLPPHEYLGQKLGSLFGDPHRKDLPVEHWPSKISVKTHGAGGKPDNCPPLPDLPCLFDPHEEGGGGVLRRVWNRTNLIVQCKSEPLAGYLNLLLTLLMS